MVNYRSKIYRASVNKR